MPKTSFVLLLCFGQMLLLPSFQPIAAAQTAAPGAFTSASSPAQSVPAAAPLTFDAVSIKQNKSGTGNSGARSNLDGDVFMNESLEGIIGPAYNVQPDDVYGLPEWVKTNRYDMQFKVAPEDVPAYHKLRGAGARRLMQAVLEDRLKLKAHLGSKEVPMYQLVIAKGGSKLHQATPGDTYANGLKMSDGTPMGGPGATMRRGMFIGQQVPVSDLLESLKGATGRPVLDKTGLTGKFDISLHWVPDLGPSSPDSAPVDDAGPTIFGALEDQLGLKLEPTKGTIPTLIIDHIEPPSED